MIQYTTIALANPSKPRAHVYIPLSERRRHPSRRSYFAIGPWVCFLPLRRPTGFMPFVELLRANGITPLPPRPEGRKKRSSDADAHNTSNDAGPSSNKRQRVDDAATQSVKPEPEEEDEDDDADEVTFLRVRAGIPRRMLRGVEILDRMLGTNGYAPATPCRGGGFSTGSCEGQARGVPHPCPVLVQPRGHRPHLGYTCFAHLAVFASDIAVQMLCAWFPAIFCLLSLTFSLVLHFSPLLPSTLQQSIAYPYSCLRVHGCRATVGPAYVRIPTTITIV